MAQGCFTLAQLAQHVDISLDEVRLYRDRGLLPAPRRMRSRSDDVAFRDEHVDRLKFIKRALECGLALEDIARLVDPAALVTCSDVYAVAERRLEQVRRSGGPDTPAAAILEKLLEACPRVGPRRDCRILATLSNADC